MKSVDERRVIVLIYPPGYHFPKVADVPNGLVGRNLGYSGKGAGMILKILACAIREALAGDLAGDEEPSEQDLEKLFMSLA